MLTASFTGYDTHPASSLACPGSSRRNPVFVNWNCAGALAVMFLRHCILHHMYDPFPLAGAKDVDLEKFITRRGLWLLAS